jgi:hypothetical protein
MVTTLKQVDENTIEINGNFYCKKCRHIKDYSDDPCHYCNRPRIRSLEVQNG